MCVPIMILVERSFNNKNTCKGEGR
uniref:Uncharacterized protein n=1 Tax=Rhizophora mucronata TaxID=61149 RepID=A0A2P2MVT5_RHIMU